MDEVVDLLARLVGVLREDDLKDPVLAGLLSQLVQVLDQEPPPFPPDLAEQLATIPNKIERFKRAADALRVVDPDKLRDLAQSMKRAGLFKADNDRSQ